MTVEVPPAVDHGLVAGDTVGHADAAHQMPMING